MVPHQGQGQMPANTVMNPKEYLELCLNGLRLLLSLPNLQ
jgi:hypothetical protein